MALMRCSVRSMPARLSSPNTPMWSMTWAMSASVISRSRRSSSPVVKRACGRRPRSITTSSRSVRLARPRSRSQISGGSASMRASRSSVVSRRATFGRASPRSSPHAQRVIAGTIAGWRTCARTSRTRSVTRPIGSKPVASAARVPADSYVRTGDRMPAAIASLAGAREHRAQEARAVGPRRGPGSAGSAVRRGMAPCWAKPAARCSPGRSQASTSLKWRIGLSADARHDRLVARPTPSRRRRSPRCARWPAAWRGSTGRTGATRPARRRPGAREVGAAVARRAAPVARHDGAQPRRGPRTGSGGRHQISSCA